MCGIAGFVGKQGTVNATELEGMAEAIVHRGPNDSGFWGRTPSGQFHRWHKPGEKGGDFSVAFGFRRLSILDLSPNGAQPMTSHDGRYVLIFNGQIYNYVELKEELPEVKFRSTGDTEVLVHALAKWGMDALKKFRGIFAFAFHDTQTGKTWVARDALGVKPVYYCEDRRGLFFGSEIRALLPMLAGKPRLDRSLLGTYLMCNWVPDPDTLFEGIRKLEPGHYLEFDKGGTVTNRRWWEFNFKSDEDVSLAEWSERLDAVLGRVVNRQMRSDVPLGFFLSGGVDSSLLTAEAARLKQHKPATFTTGFKWGASQADQLDVESARLMKSHFDLDYNELLLEPSIVSILPKVVACLEEPIADAAAICSYLICEAASKKFTVMISGQGGDELFGGYPVYQAGWVGSAVNRLPGLVKDFAASLSGHMPYAIGGREIQSVHRLQKVLAASREAWPDTFLLLRSPMRSEQMMALLSPELRGMQASPFRRHLEKFESAGSWDRIHQMLFLDSKTYLPALNLTYSDKTSMAHSVELRVPLLDPEIVDLVERVPSRYKVTLESGKVLLKRLADRKLPRAIVHRRKMGFGLPLRQWFLEELQPMARDLLSPDRLRRQGYFDPDLPTQWLNEHRDKQADHCMKLYNLMTFQLWTEAFGVG